MVVGSHTRMRAGREQFAGEFGRRNLRFGGGARHESAGEASDDGSGLVQPSGFQERPQRLRGRQGLKRLADQGDVIAGVQAVRLGEA